MERYLPIKIKNIVRDMQCEEINIGCSGAKVYKFSDVDKVYYLKVHDENDEILREYEVLKWLENKAAVPTVIEYCIEDKKIYMLTSEIQGAMSCSDENLNDVEETVRLLAEGINHIQSIDITACPFDATIEYKLKCAEYNIENNLVDMEDFEESNDFEIPELLFDWLKENKPEEELVFIHGDYCLPNIFFNESKVSGFIDLGRAGVGDKWQDIALCVRSLKYNFKSDKYTDLFFDCLKIEPNWEKINYYILLDELF